MRDEEEGRDEGWEMRDETGCLRIGTGADGEAHLAAGKLVLDRIVVMG